MRISSAPGKPASHSYAQDVAKAKKTDEDRQRRRGIPLNPEAVRRALETRYPQQKTRKAQIAAAARTGLISQRWLYRALERKPAKVDIEQARKLAAAMRCSVDALIAVNDENYRRDNLADRVARAPNPFRGMQAHGKNDPLYGRETETRTICRWVNQGLDGIADRLIHIVGPTGSGKSSLLAAGVLQTLSTDKARKAITFILSPGDFPPNPEDLSSIGVFRKKLDEVRTEDDREFELQASHESTAEFARDLAGIAARKQPIVIGIDDAGAFLGDKQVWKPVHNLLTELLQATRHVCVVTTTRPKDFPASETETAWYARPSRKYRLGPPTREFLHALIEEPFEIEGYRLAAKQVDELIENTLRLSRDTRHPRQDQPSDRTADLHETQDLGSPLPLLSLTLQLLFDKKQRSRFPDADELRDHHRLADQEEGLGNARIRHADLEVSNTIERRAERAWKNWSKRRDQDQHKGISGLTNDDLSSLFCALLYLPAETLAPPPETYDQQTSDACLSHLQLGTLKRPPFESFKGFFDDMIEDGLIRETSKEGVRLAHRSVLVHWQRAQDWLAKPHGTDEQGDGGLTGWELLRLVSALRSDDFDAGSLSESSAATALAIFTPWSLAPHRPFWIDIPIRRAQGRLTESCDAAADVEGVPSGVKVIHLLALYGMSDVIRRQLKGLDAPTARKIVNTKRKHDHRTPLHNAAFCCDLETIKALLHFGADANAVDLHGFTPLAICAASATEGENPAFQLLATQSLQGVNPRQARLIANMCVKTDNVERLNEVLAQRPELLDAEPDSGWTLLQNAVYFDSTRIATELLTQHRDATIAIERARRAWVREQDREATGGQEGSPKTGRRTGPRGTIAISTALHTAAQFGKTRVLQSLLELEDSRSSTELMAAWTGGETDATTPLMIACEQHNADVIRILATRVQAMQRASSGLTALHVACGTRTNATRNRAIDIRPRPRASARQLEAVYEALTAYADCDWFAVAEPPGKDTPSPDSHWQLAPIGQAVKDPTTFRALLTVITRTTRPLPMEQAEARCNPIGSSLVHFLAQHHDRDWAVTHIQTSLPKGVSVTTPNRLEQTPLTLALDNGLTANARSLLQHLPVTEQNEALRAAAAAPEMHTGRTAHHSAALRCDLRAARDLVVFGAADRESWQQQDNFGCSAAELAGGPVRQWLEEQTNGPWAPPSIARQGRRTFLNEREDGSFSLAPSNPTRRTRWDTEVDWLGIADENIASHTRDAIRADSSLAKVPDEHLLVASLPFYSPDVVIVRVSDQYEPERGRRVCRHSLILDGEVLGLWGWTGNLHKVAKAGKLTLAASPQSDEEWHRAAMFLRFFCEFCHADAGPFLIVDPFPQRQGNDLGLSDSEMRQLDELVRPITFHTRRIGPSKDAPGAYLSATVWYSNALFYSDFAITDDGSVDMLGDCPILGNLSAVPDRPIWVR